jgi:hypothetical protein
LTIKVCTGKVKILTRWNIIHRDTRLAAKFAAKTNIVGNTKRPILKLFEQGAVKRAGAL